MPNTRLEWLTEGDLQADALGDLRTTNNGLSLYVIDDELSNLESVAAAMAANAPSTANVDYILLNIEEVHLLNIKSVWNPGDTPSEEVNASHIDLVELTAQKLLALAQVLQYKGKTGRIREPRITNLILKDVQLGKINRELIKIQSTSFWGKLRNLP